MSYIFKRYFENNAPEQKRTTKSQTRRRKSRMKLISSDLWVSKPTNQCTILEARMEHIGSFSLKKKKEKRRKRKAQAARIILSCMISQSCKQDCDPTLIQPSLNCMWSESICGCKIYPTMLPVILTKLIRNNWKGRNFFLTTCGFFHYLGKEGASSNQNFCILTT